MRKPHTILTKEEIQGYLEGRVTGKAAHRIERMLLQDSFAQEAMEGFEEMGLEDIGEDLAKLQHRLSAGRKRQSGLVWRIAAVVALFIVGSAILWLLLDREEGSSQISMNDPGIESNEMGPDRKEQALPPEVQVATKPVPFKALPAVTEQREQLTEQAKKEISPLPEEPDLVDYEALAEGSMDEEKTMEELIADQKPQVAEGLAMAQSRAMAPGHGALNGNVVKGRVTDQFDTPLPGVKVEIRDFPYGVITDDSGRYSIELVDPKAVLRYSHSGYEPAELGVPDHGHLDVELETEAQALAEEVYTYEVPSDIGYISAEPSVGAKAYQVYLINELNYPREALARGVKGRVILRVTISGQGEIGPIEVRRGLGHGCDEEAIKLVKEGPKWKPAIKDGKPVESQVKVRVDFGEQ